MKEINSIENNSQEGFKKNSDLDKYANKVLFKKKGRRSKEAFKYN